MSDLNFSHLDPMGRARMVDVTPKEPTHRRAIARCKVFMKPATTAAIANREVKKAMFWPLLVSRAFRHQSELPK